MNKILEHSALQHLFDVFLVCLYFSTTFLSISKLELAPDLDQFGARDDASEDIIVSFNLV